jgi:hypothetical protein
VPLSLEVSLGGYLGSKIKNIRKTIRHETSTTDKLIASKGKWVSLFLPEIQERIMFRPFENPF